MHVAMLYTRGGGVYVAGGHGLELVLLWLGHP
jgi:hypothetical protein